MAAAKSSNAEFSPEEMRLYKTIPGVYTVKFAELHGNQRDIRL